MNSFIQVADLVVDGVVVPDFPASVPRVKIFENVHMNSVCSKYKNGSPAGEELERHQFC
jgi:hypothetical protein